MKFVKFGIFALSMGLFVASCGDNASTEGEGTNDTTTIIETPAPEAAPVTETTTDSTTVVTPDSTTTTTTTTTETH